MCSQVSVEQMTEGHRSERVVGERKLALREPYGARRTRLREYQIDSRSQNKPRESEVFLCSQVSVEQMTEGHRSERVVGERKLALREPYGARRTRLREYQIDSRSQNKPRESEVFLCSQVSVEQMTEGHRSERVVGENEIEKRSFLYFFIH